MADGVISVTFKGHLGVIFLHPPVKRIMEKKISQDRADHRTLRRPFLWPHQSSIRHTHRRPEPPLYVERYPFALRVTPHRSHQEFLIEVVIEPLDVKLKHPVKTPATLTCDR